MLFWSIVIHVALFLAAVGYAAFLNQKWVYERYHPNWTILTVIGGDILIGFALAAECYIGVLPWLILLPYATLHVAAGIPIWLWQRQQRKKRRQIAEAIDRRP